MKLEFNGREFHLYLNSDLRNKTLGIICRIRRLVVEIRTMVNLCGQN